MVYVPQTWNNNDPTTPISAARLTVMENGIAAAATYASPTFTGTVVLPATAITETMASDTTVSGLVVVKTAGETLAFGDLVYFKSDGLAWKASATDNTKIAVGMAAGAITVSTTGQILLWGTARNAAWSFTVGQILYLSTANVLTGTAPTATNNTTQVMGICHPDTHHVFFRPSLDYITHV